MTLLILYGTISIAFSFLCSILESVLLSVTPTFIAVKKNEGKSYANTLEKLKDDIDKPIIAILSVNTIAHTVGAILVGVQAEKTFGSGDNSVGIVSTIMTLLILIVSEIIPKSIGAKYWKELANFSSKAITSLMFPLKYTGILWLLQFFTKLVGESHSASVSREDLHAMADMAEEEGVFQEKESKLMKNLINFEKVLVKDIMTPRTVMKISSNKKIIQDFYEENLKLKFSRIPVYDESVDDIRGYILKDEMLESIIKGNGKKPLETIQREIMVTNRDEPIPSLFDKLIEHQEHVALVVDEFGSVSGLVTQEDIIETLLGLEIMDESDSDEDLQALARKLWEIRANRLGIIDKEINDNQENKEDPGEKD
ncbi:MAG: CNNM domain-containing protein [Bacteroidota bacterium]